MTKTTIHFAHANGFPAQSYADLLDRLKPHHKVIHKDVLAHDPNFPVTRGWKNSADEVIEFIEANADQPVIGLGHSFGATISLIAAVKRPELFRSLVLMDPVIVVGFVPTQVGRLLRRLNLLGKFTPAEKTAVRKRHWVSKEEAAEYFKQKALFRNFTEESIRKYVEHGLVEYSNGFELKFDVSTEVQIYRSIPLDLDQLPPVSMPGKIIRGTTTDVSRSSFVRRLSKKHRFEIEEIGGGHMFPFESPAKVAQAILSATTFT